MNTVKRRFLMFLHEVGRRNIRQNHAFFNDFMGIITHDRLNTFNTSQRIENKFAFNGFKFDSATLLASFYQCLIHFMQVL